MYRYNNDRKLITSSIPIKQEGYILVDMTDKEAEFCIGFNTTGQPIYDEVARAKSQLAEKQKIINQINLDFEKQCSDIGVTFEGNYFQYDDTSRARLLETKDDSRVTFWRSVANSNITMSNVKKNQLYDLLKLTYYTKFAEKSAQIDALGV